MSNKNLRKLFMNFIITINTLKWFFLAIIAGVLVGLAGTVFLHGLDYSIKLIGRLSYFYLLIPLGFITSIWLIRTFAPEAKGHGTEKVIEALNKKNGDIDAKVIPVKLLATIITISTGGSAGKEGPCAQIGAGVASTFAKIFKMSEENRKRFVLCGVSAGFSAVFGTPIAGAFFASEVIYVGTFSYRDFLPSLVASYFSFFVTRHFNVKHLIYNINPVIESDVSMIFYMLILGILIGITAILFIWMLHKVEHFTETRKANVYIKGLIGGALIILIVLITGSTNHLGLGTPVIDSALDGQVVGRFDSILKMLTTSITLGTGGSGGVLSPIFFIGATAGNFFGNLLNQDLAMFSAVGMMSFLAATTNTPLAAILLGFELFGVQVGSFGAIACAVSYLMVGHMSVYPSQVLSVNKYCSTEVKTQKEMKDIDRADYVIKDPNIIKLSKKIKKFFRIEK